MAREVTNQILAYRREDGSVGVRNHVVVLPVDDISNAAVEGVARLVRGTLALPHPYGRLQFGEDLELHFRTLIGTGCNPNVAAVVVIGIEPNWTKRVADGIAASGKPVSSFHIERTGDLGTIEKAARAAKELVHYATSLGRQECDLFDLVISTKCGESDTTSGLASNPLIGKIAERVRQAGGTFMFGETSELTGGEHLVAERFTTDEQRQRFQKLFDAYQDDIAAQGADLLGSQPTEGNIAGGLTTIEEKALGNIQKIGGTQVDSALSMAERPQGPGVHFMDTSSAAAESVTLFAAGGAALHLFTTGQGNIVGNPIVPVLKITANPVTMATMSEHIDLDASNVMTREETLEDAADRLQDLMVATATGRWTAAETLGHHEFVLTRLYRSA